MPETTVPTEEQVLARVREELAAIKVPGAEDATMETQWSELDVDSLDLVELAQIVEDEYGVELKGDDVKDVKTVGEVIDLVVAKAG